MGTRQAVSADIAFRRFFFNWSRLIPCAGGIEEEGLRYRTHPALSIYQSVAPSRETASPVLPRRNRAKRSCQQPNGVKPFCQKRNGVKPFCQILVGLSRFELLTPRLSSVCSNQLSYRPSFPSTLARSMFQDAIQHSAHGILSKNRCTGPIPSKLDRRARHEFPSNQRNGAKPLCQIRVRSILEIALRSAGPRRTHPTRKTLERR